MTRMTRIWFSGFGVQLEWSEKMLYAELTDKIISSFFKVYNTLGYGFLERVYENALVIELKRAGFNVLQQENIKYIMKIGWW